MDNKKYYTLVCKIPLECEEKLNYLTRSYGVSKAGFIRSMICNEYDKISDNSEAQALLEQMRELGKTFENLTGYKVINKE